MRRDPEIVLNFRVEAAAGLYSEDGLNLGDQRRRPERFGEKVARHEDADLAVVFGVAGISGLFKTGNEERGLHAQHFVSALAIECFGIGANKVISLIFQRPAALDALTSP
jgi:hypothetical protein